MRQIIVAYSYEARLCDAVGQGIVFEDWRRRGSAGEEPQVQ